ncbi:MAG: hypothetical protein OEV17_01860, partial [Nitrospira sp.]|nr:hypothetical protein [Nitrospira sp.]
MDARWNGFGCALGLVLLGTILLAGSGGCVKAKVVKPESPKLLAGVVRFTILAPGAKQVHLVGSFNGWGKNATPMKIMDS